MTKKSRPVAHYPGELARLTVLIERKAKEIAEVLLHDVPDLEQQEEQRQEGRSVARKSSRGKTRKLSPEPERDMKREHGISAARHRAYPH